MSVSAILRKWKFSDPTPTPKYLKYNLKRTKLTLNWVDINNAQKIKVFTLNIETLKQFSDLTASPKIVNTAQKAQNDPKIDLY